MAPKVSIIVPCYNSEKWIEQALTSALTQSWQNLEVIFVDNESVDSSVEIAERIKPQLMKSRIQTYDPRDSDEFKGVFETEVLIQSETQQKEITDKINQKMKELFQRKKKVGKNNIRVKKSEKDN